MLVLLGPTLEQDYAEQAPAAHRRADDDIPGLAGRIVLHPGLPRDDYLATLREVDV